MIDAQPNAEAQRLFDKCIMEVQRQTLSLDPSHACAARLRLRMLHVLQSFLADERDRDTAFQDVGSSLLNGSSLLVETLIVLRPPPRSEHQMVAETLTKYFRNTIESVLDRERTSGNG